MIEKMTRIKKEDKKEAECLDDTSPVDMEEVVSDRKDYKNKKMMRKDMQNAMMTLLLLRLRKV